MFPIIIQIVLMLGHKISKLRNHWKHKLFYTWNTGKYLINVSITEQKHSLAHKESSNKTINRSTGLPCKGVSQKCPHPAETAEYKATVLKQNMKQTEKVRNI